MGGDRRSVLKPQRDWLRELLARENDLTLAAIAARLWAERGVKADASMLSRFFKAERISFKKTVRAAEQLRPDMAAWREAWRAAQAELAGRRLIFLDESGAATDMTRRRGWAPVGERAVGYAPAGHWRTTTFLAGLAADALVAPFVLDGPINRPIFT